MKIVFQTADETLLVRNENGEIIVNVERLLGLLVVSTITYAF